MAITLMEGVMGKKYPLVRSICERNIHLTIIVGDFDAVTKLLSKLLDKILLMVACFNKHTVNAAVTAQAKR
jgi:hypothetical protein